MEKADVDGQKRTLQLRSARLAAVAELVDPGAVVADVGTDHGYLPIHLVQQGRVRHVIALDLREGPLSRAREHVKACGLQEAITLRLSDGLTEVAPGEVDTVILSGMGGPLMERILTEGAPVVEAATTLILQPQSEIPHVRRYVHAHGFRFLAEDMAREGDQFYPMMKVAHGAEAPWAAYEYQYGKLLLSAQHPVLRAYLTREQEEQAKIRAQLLQAEPTGRVLDRLHRLTEEMEENRQAFACYE